MASEYLQKLYVENPDVGERYQLKLKLINYLDPFTLKEDEVDYSIDGIPPVTNMDIVSYLVLSHSYYTKEQMKAFKSLQAYKYLESGFVKVGTKQVDNFYVLVGKGYFFLRILFFVCMVICNGAVWTLFVKALQQTDSSLSATVTSSASNYIFSAVTGFVLFKETTSLFWWSGMFFILMGLLLVLSNEPNINKTEEKCN